MNTKDGTNGQFKGGGQYIQDCHGFSKVVPYPALTNLTIFVLNLSSYVVSKTLYILGTVDGNPRYVSRREEEVFEKYRRFGLSSACV